VAQLYPGHWVRLASRCLSSYIASSCYHFSSVHCAKAGWVCCPEYSVRHPLPPAMKQFIYSIYSTPLKDSPDSSVAVGMGYRLKGRRIRAQFPREAIGFSSSQRSDRFRGPAHLGTVPRLGIRGIYLRSPTCLYCVVLN
jgi:hypothetical protein